MLSLIKVLFYIYGYKDSADMGVQQVFTLMICLDAHQPQSRQGQKL